MANTHRRIKPYSTGELSRLLGVSRGTVILAIDKGEFGREGRDWWRTSGRQRRVRNSAVRRYVERTS